MTAEVTIAPMIQQLARSYIAVLQAELKPLGLTPGQLPALQVLWAKDGQTQAALVAVLQVEQATMANTLARMERDGLIERRKDERDARIRHIHLTGKARDLQAGAMAAAARAEAAFLSPLRPGQQKRLAEFLTLMSGADPAQADQSAP